MGNTTEFVDLKAERSLLRVLSSSSTTYFVDTRKESGGPRLMRARGTGSTARGPHDDHWVTLTGVTSGPVIERNGEELPDAEIVEDDNRPWVLRVGSRHMYDFHVPGGFMDTTDFWWMQRTCMAIERLDEMPPEGERTIEEKVPRDDMP